MDYYSSIMYGPEIDLTDREICKECNEITGEILDKVQTLIVSLFEEIKDSSDKVSPIKDWRTPFRAVYKTITSSTPWKTDYDLEKATMPEFNVYALVGKDMYISVIVNPLPTPSQTQTPEYLRLLREKRKIYNQTMLAYGEEYSRLSKELWRITKKLSEMWEKLPWGPKIERNATLEPFYNITVEYGKKIIGGLEFPIKPPKRFSSRTEYKPTPGEKKEKILLMSSGVGHIFIGMN